MARIQVKELSVALPEGLSAALRAKFLGYGMQEDGGFGLWRPVEGVDRRTALVREWVWPERGEVEHHGNITLSTNYYSRARERARELNCGLVIAHSHPGGAGWQQPSSFDVQNEQDHLGREIYDLTDLPLVGMILSGEGKRSGRFYEEDFRGRIRRRECISVKSIGKFLDVHFNPQMFPSPPLVDSQMRTRTVWGDEKHNNLCRLRVGLAGFGSVGSLVAEQLARMGIERLRIFDFDSVQVHNLDRLIHARAADAKHRMKKVDLGKSWIPFAATSRRFELNPIDGSIVEPATYQLVLDCDVVFSCVDMNWPRQVLNHLSYSCGIPVVDGGVSIRVRENGELQHAVVRAQTVGPGRACLNCLVMYNSGLIQMERDGTLANPRYIEQLGEKERRDFEQERQNIMPFSTLLSGLEVSQFVELCTAMAETGDLGRQQYNFATGEINPDYTACHSDCEYARMTFDGSRNLPVLGPDPQKLSVPTPRRSGFRQKKRKH